MFFEIELIRKKIEGTSKTLAAVEAKKFNRRC